MQCYCYPAEFVGKGISAQKLEQLQSSFDTLHRLGMKAVLRFAYGSKPGGTRDLGQVSRESRYVMVDVNLLGTIAVRQ